MKGGRLRIINESRYPLDEVEALVRFGLQEIDVTGCGLVAVVKNTKRAPRWTGGRIPPYSGTARSLGQGIPATMYDRYMKGRRDVYLIVMRLGPPNTFPIVEFERHGHRHDYRTWQEALAGVTAHEGMHVQHYHDDAYRTRSGYRKASRFARGAKVRIGSERVEPRCAAHERKIVERFRAEAAVDKGHSRLLRSGA